MEGIEAPCFPIPSTVLIAGGTGSGKSTLVSKLISNKELCFRKPIRRVIYCYRVYQKSFEDLKDVEFHEGIPDFSSIQGEEESGIILILDDLMHQINKETAECFTVHSSKQNLCTIMLTQNLFHRNPYFRDITLNTQHMIIFRLKRDLSSIVNLAKQICPGQSEQFLKVYNDFTQAPFSHFYIDLDPRTSLRLKISSSCLPWEAAEVYYS